MPEIALAGGAGEAAIPTRLILDGLDRFAPATADLHLPIVGGRDGPGARFTTLAASSRAVPDRLAWQLRVAQSGSQDDTSLEISAGGLILYGSAGGDLLEGGSANDFISGVHGDDILNGGAGDDTMVGGPGDDIFHVDSLFDVVAESSGEGFDTVRVSVGNYRIPANVEQAILEGTADLGLFGNSGKNALIGNGGHNRLEGLEGGDRLYGGGGNDQLFGGAGADLLAGEDGNDSLDGGPGDDRMIGGAGSDTYFVDSHSDRVVESPGEGYDTVYVSVGTYHLPDGIEQGILLGTAHIDMFGNAGANTLTGNDGDNRLGGLAGNDTLHGGGGNDELFGFSGDDRLYGGGGDDWLLGYHGTDLLDGGAGNDIFAFWESLDSLPGAHDTISGFHSAVGPSDMIDLSVMDPNRSLHGDQAFVWSEGAAAYSVWYEWEGDTVIISADTNGDALADFTLHVMCGGVFFTEDVVL